MRPLSTRSKHPPARALLLLALLPVLLSPSARPARADRAEEVVFLETGLSLSNEHGFLDYWRNHGGLAQFGFPRTAEILEVNPADGKLYTVQWFERNRFEWHPELRGTPYEVLLGLLGNQIVGDPQAPEVPVASVSTPLSVPPQFRSGAFSTDRTMVLPPGFTISVFAGGLPGARFMAVAVNGDLFVSEKTAGKVVVLPDRDRDGVADGVTEFARDLAKPHGLAFWGGYLYVATEAAVIRYPYGPGDLSPRGPAETVVPNLPSGPGSGLVGGVNHDTRTIVFGPDGKIYVSVGSSCDSCIEGDPRRAAVLQFNPDGSDHWGSPVDVIFGADGALYISDDVAGAVYRVTAENP